MLSDEMNVLPTVSTAQSGPQIWPDKERWQVGGQVEVSLWIRILRQWQVLHQVIISAKTQLLDELSITFVF